MHQLRTHVVAVLGDIAHAGTGATHERRWLQLVSCALRALSTAIARNVAVRTWASGMRAVIIIDTLQHLACAPDARQMVGGVADTNRSFLHCANVPVQYSATSHTPLHTHTHTQSRTRTRTHAHTRTQMVDTRSSPASTTPRSWPTNRSTHRRRHCHTHGIVVRCARAIANIDHNSPDTVCRQAHSVGRQEAVRRTRRRRARARL
jgi:hypothetical protein